MPTFRTQQSPSLGRSIRNFAQSRQLLDSPLINIQADLAAANTARAQSLAEKARIEADAARNAQTARNDPNAAIEYGADASGMSVPDAARLYAASRGELEQPGPADENDVLPTDQAAGITASPFPVAEPNAPAGQKNLFRAALAAVAANNLATGKTNAAQLAQAGGRVRDQQIVEGALEEDDPTLFNRALVAAGKRPYLPNRATSGGLVLDQATGETSTDNPMAGATIAARAAQAAASRYRASGAARAATPVAAERIQRMIETSAQAEFKIARAAYDALPLSQRKATKPPSFEDTLRAVEARYRKRPGASVDPVALQQEAADAIAAGADPDQVAARYKQQTGLDLELPEEE